MKKVLICLLSVAFILAVGGMAFAKVSGPCVNCHTMHNSQGNLGMELKDNTGTPLATGPFGALVRSSCLGCHTTTGTDPLAAPSGGSGLYPFVKSTGGSFTDNNCLAGGFFPVMEKTATGFVADNSGGNAHSLNSPNDPPGYNSDWYGAESGSQKLSCAGDLGCHGDQLKKSWDSAINKEMDAIRGGHHGSAEVAFGYRMLMTYRAGIRAPVASVGAPDYEKALIANTTAPTGAYSRTDATYPHNVYSAGVDDNGTISRLCANCHGDYHDLVSTGNSSPWRRHPTDLALPTSWDPADDNISSNVDCKYNPFGFAVGAINTAGAKYATCLSCHRAHGTDSMDLLRFGYNTALGDSSTGQSAGSGNMYGCLGCHSNQR